MCRRQLWLSLALLCFLSTHPVMARGAPMPVNGTIEILIGAGAFTPAVGGDASFSQSFSVVTSVSPGHLTMPANVFTWFGTSPLAGPLGLYATEARLTSVVNGVGALAPGGAPAPCPGGPAATGACVAGTGSGGIMRLFGTLRFYNGAFEVANVANVIGEPVTAMGSFGLTFAGAPWTTGTAFVQTRDGAVFSTVGSPLITGAGGGSGTLVSTGLIDLNPSVPVLARMTLTIVPEPTGIVLVGAGLVSLAMARRRARSHRELGRASMHRA